MNCPVMQAETRYADRTERKEARREQNAKHLAAEYLAAACVPLISTVSVPTDRNRNRRAPFLEIFLDDLSWSKNRHLASRAIAILNRSAEGQEILKELSEQHGESYCEEIAE